jgi:hypothetical protein
MTNEIKKFAEVFGLDLYAAKIYLGLASVGPSNITQISRAASLPRTAIYAPLKSLLAKGYIGTIMLGRRKLYQAINPERMKYILEQRHAEGNRLIDEIINTGIISSSKNDLGIQYFEGAQGVSVAGQIFLDETNDKSWYSFENPVGVTELVSLDFETNYIKERVKRGIHSRVIMTTDVMPTWLKEFLRRDKEQLRETIILSPNQFRFDSTIVATRGLVLMINALENPFAVLIRNRHLAATLINIHKIIWGRYKVE